MSNSWLVIADSENRLSVGNEGYDDDPASHYSWNTTVPHALDLSVGDTLVLRSKVTLLGVGVLERIESREGQFERKRCPFCKGTDVRERRTLQPRYKCGSKDCKKEFGDSEVRTENVDVEEFTGHYGASWVDLYGQIDAPRLKGFCLKPRTQHAITEIRWEEFLAALSGKSRKITTVFTGIQPPGTGDRRSTTHGHADRKVRVRLGQQAFRADMRKRFNDTCAFTGPMPHQVLDAAHLYSYSAEEYHHPHGGMLLRKDMHRLFDLGAISVNPEDHRIDVSAEFRGVPDYGVLHGAKLRVDLPAKAKKWLRLHWKQWRS